MSLEISRYKAVKTLLNYGVTELPVTHDIVSDILVSIGCTVIPFSKNDPRKDFFENMGLSDWVSKYPAFTCKHNNKIYVFYREDRSSTERAELLAHELGHIVLGHLDGIKKQASSVSTDYENVKEYEADIFSQELLAPTCILKACKVKNTSELMELTLVYLSWSEQSLGRSKSRTIQTPEELELIKQFYDYITKIRIAKFKTAVRKILPMLILVISLMFSTGYFSNETGKIESTINCTSETIDVSEQSIVTQETPSPLKPHLNSVYVTKSGEKYHNIDCYSISGREVFALDLEDAIEDGYTACKICNKGE